MLTFPVTLFGGGAAVRTFLQSETPKNAAATTYTFSSVNFGPAAGDRYIVVVVGGYQSLQSRTLNTVSISGTNGTIVANANVTGVGFTGVTGIAMLLVPTTTSGDVVVTFSAGMINCFCHTYALTGLTMGTPTTPFTTKTTTNTTNSTNVTDTINVPSSGVMIAGTMTASSAGVFNAASGVTFDSETHVNSIPSSVGSSQNLAAETGRSYGFTVSAATAVTAMAAATWN